MEPAATAAMFAHARKLSDDHRWDEAVEVYDELLRHAPEHEAAWFNAGLLHKWRKAWDACLRCNLRAAALAKDPKGEPAWWNAGIAATALGDWTTARRAWTAYGLRLPAGEGRIEADFGLAAIRLGAADEGEVVWARRIDPARARIESVPLPEAKHRWGDLVLNDGAPEGERRANGRTYRVFAELERLQPSDFVTHTVTVTAPDVDDVRALVSAFGDAGLTAEDWGRTLRVLCDACSRGRPHAHVPTGDWEGSGVIGVAAPAVEVLEPVLRGWAGSGRRRSYEAPLVAF